jgi:hypothetical protein
VGACRSGGAGGAAAAPGSAAGARAAGSRGALPSWLRCSGRGPSGRGAGRGAGGAGGSAAHLVRHQREGVHVLLVHLVPALRAGAGGGEGSAAARAPEGGRSLRPVPRAASPARSQRWPLLYGAAARPALRTRATPACRCCCIPARPAPEDRRPAWVGGHREHLRLPQPAAPAEAPQRRRLAHARPPAHVRGLGSRIGFGRVESELLRCRRFHDLRPAGGQQALPARPGNAHPPPMPDARWCPRAASALDLRGVQSSDEGQLDAASRRMTAPAAHSAALVAWWLDALRMPVHTHETRKMKAPLGFLALAGMRPRADERGAFVSIDPPRRCAAS